LPVVCSGYRSTAGRAGAPPGGGDQGAAARQLVKRYRDPLLLAAFDLQSRLFNIVRMIHTQLLVGGGRSGGLIPPRSKPRRPRSVTWAFVLAGSCTAPY
jgi:hypothetical protein